MAIEWTPAISVGDATIDAQHKNLLSKINDLLVALSERKGSKVIKDIVDYLDVYINEHLAHEEQYMIVHGYPEFAEHRALHIDFVKQYKKFRKEMESEGNTALAIKVQNFLGGWWLNHIGKEDKKYFQYISTHDKCHPDSERSGYHDSVQT